MDDSDLPVDETGSPHDVTAAMDATAADTPGGAAPIDQPAVHGAEISIQKRRHRLTAEGAELDCIVRVYCHKSCDLSGTPVIVVCEDDGQELLVYLSAFNKVENETAEFTLRTGNKPGRYAFTAYYASDASEAGDADQDKAGAKPIAAHAEVSHSLAFDFYPHRLSLAAWDIPMVNAGEGQVSVKVGVKCSNACLLAGRTVSLYDSQGSLVAEATLGDDLWAGSDALYWATLSFDTPAEAGVYSLAVRVDGWLGPDGGDHDSLDLGEPGQVAGMEAERDDHASHDHLPAATTITLSVIKPAEHSLTLMLVDKDTAQPVTDATARVHPHRRKADIDGRVTMPVDKGKITLLVTSPTYETLSYDVIVTGDAELAVELTQKVFYEGDF